LLDCFNDWKQRSPWTEGRSGDEIRRLVLEFDAGGLRFAGITVLAAKLKRRRLGDVEANEGLQPGWAR